MRGGQVIRGLLLVLGVVFLSCCTTMQPGHYGLIAVREPRYAQDGSAIIHIDRSQNLSGSSCYRMILGFFSVTFDQNRDAAVQDAIAGTKSAKVIGLADASIYERSLFLWPFYLDRCYFAEGHPATIK